MKSIVANIISDCHILLVLGAPKEDIVGGFVDARGERRRKYGQLVNSQIYGQWGRL